MRAPKVLSRIADALYESRRRKAVKHLAGRRYLVKHRDR